MLVYYHFEFLIVLEKTPRLKNLKYNTKSAIEILLMMMNSERERENLLDNSIDRFEYVYMVKQTPSLNLAAN